MYEFTFIFCNVANKALLLQLNGHSDKTCRKIDSGNLFKRIRQFENRSSGIAIQIEQFQRFLVARILFADFSNAFREIIES